MFVMLCMDTDTDAPNTKHTSSTTDTTATGKTVGVTANSFSNDRYWMYMYDKPIFFLFKVSNRDIERVDEEISQVPHGDMKAYTYLFHGAAGVGKTCVKRLILNEPPVEQESTRLMEDPVKTISTSSTIRNISKSKAMSIDKARLEKLDGRKMISMIQRQIKVAAEEKKKASSETKSKKSLPQATAHFGSAYRPTNSPSHMSSDMKHNRSPPSAAKLKPSPFRIKVLRDIATDLDSLDPDMPSLFQCHHVNLIDSGGQPQFSNLLPLVLQTQSLHHLVVIRLDKKLSDKSNVSFRSGGVEHVQQEKLAMTNLQLIERVCQVASGTNSRVIIVGTHFDHENKEEPLAKKIELLEPLKRKYESNLVLTDGKPIIAVNAMAPVGKVRELYSQTLQEVILNAPILTEDCQEANHKGISVDIRWILLELELSLRSEDEDRAVFRMSEVEEIAHNLRIDNLPEALKFFNKLSLHHYYPEALPGRVFTSITPISARLSDIVEASFVRKYGVVSPVKKKLQKTGEATTELLKQLFPKLPADHLFPLNDFVFLMENLRVFFAIDSNTFLIPSLLPVETLPSENNYHEPLLCFWKNNGEIRILPQSYFHALIVELSRSKDIHLNVSCKHSRSTFHFLFTLPSGDKYRLRLVDRVFWLEVSVDGFANRDECQLLLDIIQSSTMRVLEQLKLKHIGELQYGLCCYSPKCSLPEHHPSECFNRMHSIFACLSEDHHTCTWKEENENRLFWFKGIYIVPL